MPPLRRSQRLQRGMRSTDTSQLQRALGPNLFRGAPRIQARSERIGALVDHGQRLQLVIKVRTALASGVAGGPSTTNKPAALVLYPICRAERVQARGQRVGALVDHRQRLQLVVQDAHGLGQRRGGRAVGAGARVDVSDGRAQVVAQRGQRGGQTLGALVQAVALARLLARQPALLLWGLLQGLSGFTQGLPPHLLRAARRPADGWLRGWARLAHLTIGRGLAHMLGPAPATAQGVVGAPGTAARPRPP